jgi:3-hydroxybutyryl-CoA dehydratase
MKEIKSYIYDEIYIGMEVSIKKNISKRLINDFSRLVGDYHPLHSDNKFAKESFHEGIIAHGMLISSFSSTLVGMYLPGKNMILLSQTFDYLKPVYPGCTIKIAGKVKRKIDPLKIILIDVSISSLEGEIYSTGEMKIKLLK